MYCYALHIADHHLNEFMDLLTGRVLDGSEDAHSIENEELGKLKMKAQRQIEK